jgi:acyl-CoA synthetase (AMP-forming)/AMP-acid ligase II
MEQFGSLDVLVLNASGGMESGMEEGYALKLNRDAQVNMLNAAVPLMKEGSRVVFVTSHQARFINSVATMPEYEPVARSKRAGEDALRELLPNVTVRNSFGASESGADGVIVTGEDGIMRLQTSAAVLVVNDRLEPVQRGSGELGTLARSGHVPLGYHNDPEKTARTFPVIDGVRWAILGDLAEVDHDGSIIVHGRGSGCINTGGEKVFPEEVEQALLAHPAVMDALVAGVPDPTYGHRVAAAVQLRTGPDVQAVDSEDLRTWCRQRIAGYKVPAHIEIVEHVVRSPTGKADYRWARRVLEDGVKVR